MTTRFVPETACLRLRSKQMFYEDPEVTLAKKREADPFDATQYWCDCTQTGRGPDEQPVDRKTCCRGRTCFEGAMDLT